MICFVIKYFMIYLLLILEVGSSALEDDREFNTPLLPFTLMFYLATNLIIQLELVLIVEKLQ